jgi:hypothetical protein
MAFRPLTKSLGMVLLAGTMSLASAASPAPPPTNPAPPPATTNPVPVPVADIAAMAAKFAAETGLIDLKTCTTRPVEGKRYVCHAHDVEIGPEVQALSSARVIGIYCEEQVGCWIPPAPASK